MKKSIVKYLHKCTVLTFSTSQNGQPYCAHSFFAFDEKKKHLLFMSDATTRHISEALKNPKVGGTVNSEMKTVAHLQGIQFTGNFIAPNEDQAKEMYAIYFHKFPFARAKKSAIWAVELASIKMTDNTLGFGTKIKWER